MKQRITKEMIIGYVTLGGVAIFILIYGFGGKEEDPAKFDVRLTQKENSVYQTKLDAIKAKNNQSSIAATVKSGYQEQTLDETESSIDVEPVIDKQPEAEVRDRYSEPKRVKKQEVNKKVIERPKHKQQVEKAVPRTEISEQEREKRKRAMEESWGTVKVQESANSSKQHSDYSGSQMYSAVISGTQNVKAGQTAVIRVAQNIQTEHGDIPKHTLVYGAVTINNDRLNISIRSVRVANSILSIAFDVYGGDGMKGIPLSVNATAGSARKEIGEEVVDQVGSAVSRTGTVGRAVGSIITGVSRSGSREKEQEIRLIDNQKIFMKIADR